MAAEARISPGWEWGEREVGIRLGIILLSIHDSGNITGVRDVDTQTLTMTEAAVASRVPLKQVHRIIDAGLLPGAVETRHGTRLIGVSGLLALKLAYVTAGALKPEARRRAVLRVLEAPDSSEVRERAVVVVLEGIGAELNEGLAELAAAREMVSIDPEVLDGTPCFASTRIPVHDVADMLANGDTPAALLQAYPAIDERRIRLASVYAAAYPRRGRPKHGPAWRGSPSTSRKVHVEELPRAM